MLSLLTICFIAGSTELIARRTLTNQVAPLTPCVVRNNVPTGARAIPNSVCWEKLVEGRLTEYRFNSWGSRGRGMRTKANGRLQNCDDRYVHGVGEICPRESTFAALLPARLSQGTGRKVELYNEGLMQGFPISSALRFNDILAAKPDLILWVVTPLDVKNASLESAEEVPLALPEPPGKPNSLTRAWYLIKTAFAKNSIPELVRNHFDRTQTSLLLRHCLYESRSLYVKSFLMGGGDPVTS